MTRAMKPFSHTLEPSLEEEASAERTITHIVETVCAWAQLGISAEETLVALECHRTTVRSALPRPLTVKAYIRHCLARDHPAVQMSDASLRLAIREARLRFASQCAAEK